MNVYTLKFKKEKENSKGYWNTSIYAENEEAAIEEAKKMISENNYKNAKLVQLITREKTIYKF